MAKKFWWGVLVGVLPGTVILTDQSEFGSGVREFFSQARTAITTLFSSAGEGSRRIGETVAE